MRIRDVRTIPLECSLPQPVFDANYMMATKPALLVEVESEDGLIGLGEAAHFGGPLRSTQTVIEGELREHLVGEDPREIERLWEQMHQRAYKHARARASHRGHERCGYRPLGPARETGRDAPLASPGWVSRQGARLRNRWVLCRREGGA
jgi:hypothetical protein